MDGSVAIEWNRQALKRIVATLVDMAGLAQPSTSPLWGGRRKASGGGCDLEDTPTRRPHDRRPPHKGEVERLIIPRILWRAILALLRPAESAARRLIIATARGLVVPPPTPRQPKPQTMEPLLRRLGIAIMAPPAGAARAPGSSPAKRGVRRTTTRSVVEGALPQGRGARLSLPLFDPPRRLALYGRTHRHVPPHAAPRIWCPGITEPAQLPPPPSPDDLVSADHLTRRIAALAAALDDLPGQARRFARWKASREAALQRTVFPIRRARPPGGRLLRYDPSAAHPRNIREVDEILAHAHALALHALENPDTS